MSAQALAVGASPASTVIERACPVCASSARRFLFANRMAPIGDFSFGYDVVVCVDCATVYASSAPDAATLGRYYRDLCKYDYPRTLADLADDDLHRARMAAAFVRRLAAPHARILDVGCSVGLFLSALASAGFAHVHGIDPAPSSVRVAQSLFGVDVVVGDVDTFDDYASFDVVALLAVLEHLPEPGVVFERLAARMKSGATLIVEVPDADTFGSYDRIGFASEPFGEFSNEHINFFGAAALRALGDRVGLTWLTAESVTYRNGTAGLLAAFRKERRSPIVQRGDERTEHSITRYVASSAAAMHDVERRLVAAGSGPLVLYGAGSHSARLLAQGFLDAAQVAVVLDRNTNLAGRTIGGIPIEPPETLARFTGLPVIVSSFHAMSPIVALLRRDFENGVVPLYASRAPTAE